MIMLFNDIVSAILKYKPEEVAETETLSSVMILLVYGGPTISIVLTKRSDKVMYAGDFCFPGGQKEPLDTDCLSAAKRELQEELGITDEFYKVIGQLDDFYDRYNNRVRPYVAMIDKQQFEAQCKKSSDEVSSVYLMPLEDIQRFDTSAELEKITGRHPSYYYVNEDAQVWGLTASIAVLLGNVIFDLQKVVAKKKV